MGIPSKVLSFMKRERMSALHAVAYHKALRIVRSYSFKDEVAALGGQPEQVKGLLALIRYQRKVAKNSCDSILASMILHYANGGLPMAPTTALIVAGVFIKRHRHALGAG